MTANPTDKAEIERRLANLRDIIIAGSRDPGIYDILKNYAALSIAANETARSSTATLTREEVWRVWQEAMYPAGATTIAGLMAVAESARLSARATFSEFTGWIATKDRQPPTEGPACIKYLCWFQDDYAVLDFDNQCGWCWGNNDVMLQRHQEQVTHWRALPSGPYGTTDDRAEGK